MSKSHYLLFNKSIVKWILRCFFRALHVTLAPNAQFSIKKTNRRTTDIFIFICHFYVTSACHDSKFKFCARTYRRGCTLDTLNTCRRSLKKILRVVSESGRRHDERATSSPRARANLRGLYCEGISREDQRFRLR